MWGKKKKKKDVHCGIIYTSESTETTKKWLPTL